MESANVKMGFPEQIAKSTTNAKTLNASMAENATKGTVFVLRVGKENPARHGLRKFGQATFPPKILAKSLDEPFMT